MARMLLVALLLLLPQAALCEDTIVSDWQTVLEYFYEQGLSREAVCRGATSEKLIQYESLINGRLPAQFRHENKDLWGKRAAPRAQHRVLGLGPDLSPHAVLGVQGN